jgi:voltage-dependent anion channel protein 2
MEFQFIYVFVLATVLLSGVTLTLSSLVDLKNFNQGGHKIGMALELEA